jgi:hypothetical protein
VGLKRYKSISVSAAVLLAGCVLPLDVWDEDHDSGSDGIRGSGHAATVVRKVQDFHRIQVAGVGRVILERTGRERLSITADDNLLRYIESEVRAGTLYVRPTPGVSLNPRTTMVFRVDAKAMNRIEGSGAVTFEADLGSQPELLVTLSGVCVLEARGSVDQLEVILSGVTGYRGLALATHRARIVASGVSWAEVLVTDRLDASASGTSFIRYAGDPTEVVAHTSGLGSIAPY